ncbi:2-oxo-4-hydroxy-4-carboxy-5-ureidoimidazoline decarboxylase [Marinobacterium sp. YM272]|uniref:2-oxo-4-hydroxy-4-carboxy-5-ureidoimidazoline decarboxylase n=1 Tax=Marinobacterium sp. YM272 TaxID=3421654 RepID=UPI003D7F50A1
MKLESFNQLAPAECENSLRQCCVATRWVERMCAARPFADVEALYQCADEIWSQLSMPDYLEAFEGHPKIGDVSSLKEKYASTKQLAAGEQSGAAVASDEVLQALADGNSEYEKRFGFIFIVCATGKTAAEMLALLQARLNNDLTDELAIAAGEQAKITRLRLEKMLAEQE